MINPILKIDYQGLGSDMSDFYRKRREAAINLKKFHSALDAGVGTLVNDEQVDYKYKFNNLDKRFRELEKIYDFHRGIIQTISSGILTLGLDGKISFMNRQAIDFFGYNYLEIQGSCFSKLFAEQDKGKEILQRMMTDRLMYESEEVHFKTFNDKVVPVGFSTTEMKNPETGEDEGFIVIFRDIVVISNLRRQIERMERLATLGELSAGIAHEIRNPLAGIKTSAQVLEESFSPGDFRSQLVTRIVKEIDRSNDLLKRFFNFARPSKPKQDFCNIEMIIDGVYLLLAPRLKKKNITFRTEFSTDVPQIYADESQIEQVILNLFLNAVEAMDKKGELRVSTELDPRMKIFADSKEKGAVIVRFADNGKGIAQNRLEKIFNPFYTTKSDGVGLGLSISNRLMEENGGKIEVESKTGKGSVFSIYLPVIKK